MENEWPTHGHQYLADISRRVYVSEGGRACILRTSAGARTTASSGVVTRAGPIERGYTRY